MLIRKLPVALAAASLMIAPVAAQAAPVERAAAPTTEANELSSEVIVFGVVVALLGLWYLLVNDRDDAVSA